MTMISMGSEPPEKSPSWSPEALLFLASISPKPTSAVTTIYPLN